VKRKSIPRTEEKNEKKKEKTDSEKNKKIKFVK